MKKIELEDILKYRVPGNLTYSPDGKRLAFQVTEADKARNDYRTSVWIAADGKARQMTFSQDASIVLWEDDETLILRRKGEDVPAGKTALFRLPVGGGEAEPWMTLPFPLRQMKKLGDGYVATGSILASDPDAYLDSDEVRKQKAKEKEENNEKDYEVFDEIPYWFNGRGVINGGRTALFRIRRDGDGNAVCKRLTAPDFSVDGGLYVDGDKAWFTGTRRGQVESMTNQLYCYDGKVTCLYRKKDLSIGGPFLLKGKLYFGATDMKAYGCNQTADLCTLEGGKVRKVYVPEVSLYSSVLGDTGEGGGSGRADGDEYLTPATVDDHNAIFAFTPDGDRLKQRVVWEHAGMLCDMDVHGGRIAVVWQGWDKVAEVYEMNRDGTDMKQITRLNDEAFEGRYVAEPRRLDYESCGLKLHGWVLLPEGYSRRKKYPAVLDVHGGPRCAYGETFFHEMQLWVARGFVVFFTNIKGSDGRGDEFADIRGDYGGTDFRNLMDFTDAVMKAYPNIDPGRVCETGGSYGGFMTNWIIGHTDRFCCAASQRSISNWISMGFISDIGPFFAADQNGTKSMLDPMDTAVLWDHSPLKYVKNVKTPTLFIHSEEDYRCPMPEGMQMMQAIALQGVETRMCLFHGENHELSRSGKPLHRIRRLKEITDWFEKHTGGKA